MPNTEEETELVQALNKQLAQAKESAGKLIEILDDLFSRLRSFDELDDRLDSAIWRKDHPKFQLRFPLDLNTEHRVLLLHNALA